MKKLRSKAWNIYKTTALESWVVGLLSGLLITGLLCLDFVVSGLSVIIVPFICLPILFAAHYSHLGVHLKQKLTFGGTLRQTFGYYKRPFNSSFGVLSSILKSIIVFLVTEVFLSLFGLQITYLINPGINDSIESMQNYFIEATSVTYEDMLNLFRMNNNALLLYVSIVMLPAFILSVGFFVYNTTRNSLGIYLRINMSNNDPNYIKMVNSRTNRFYHWKIFKSWMSLNWPMIILYFLGSIGASVAALIITQNPFIVISAAVAGGILLISFFMPFYLCNMEAIYDTFAPAYQVAAQQVNDMIKKTAEENAKRAQEEKEYFDRMLKEMEEHHKEMEDQQKDENKE